MSIYLGIDPGSSGALAFVNEQGGYCGSKLFQGMSLPELAREIKGSAPAFAVIERVSAMPGQGVTSMFTFGQRFGEVQGILAALTIGYALVQPQAWRKEVGLSLPTKEKDQERAARTRAVKEATVKAAIQRWPAAAKDLSKVKCWPIADALFLAECARIRYCPADSRAEGA